MEGQGAVQQAAAGDARAVLGYGVHGALFHSWVRRQSQVVVGTEHDDLGPRIGDGRADLARQLTVERVEAELLGRPVVVELGT